jgi:hypothetical protein
MIKQEQVEKVISWGEVVGIFENGNPARQMLKTVEEFGEVADGIIKGDRDEMADGVGDVFVTIILQAKLQGYHFDDIFKALESMPLVFKGTFSEMLSCLGFLSGAIAKERKDDILRGIACVAFSLEAFADQHNLDTAECLDAAYKVIARRVGKGKMVDGVFVKNEDAA